MQRACLDFWCGKTYAHNAHEATYRHIAEEHIKLVLQYVVFEQLIA
jgi:hypothetical protein